MDFARRHRRFAVWVATLAVLLAALVPTLSHAIAASRAPTVFALCSAQAAAGSAPRGVADGGQGGATPVLVHCPYCVFQAPASGLPPAPTALPAPALPRHAQPAAFDAAPPTLHAGVSALARAPPARG